jgi:uncharacterized membrane protein YphA (DoxX/SURF4 family)
MKMKGKGQSSGSNSTTYGVVEIIIAVFLVIGLFTQLAALLNVIILLIKIMKIYQYFQWGIKGEPSKPILKCIVLIQHGIRIKKN